MITKEELDTLIAGEESFRVEKTISTTNMDKFCEAICAFANDMPNSRQCGYLLIGVTDDGRRNGLVITDDLQKKIASIRMDGNILPMPVMNVSAFHYADGDVLVVEVTPSALPPVRYRGRTFIRIGPRKDLAIVQQRPVPISSLQEKVVYNYPKWALREILMNAVMHRDYNGNAPVRFYQYDDRIEIINHGGLYGKARPENFPTVNDYRNPSIAEGMQVLGYANMLNHGIPAVQQELMKNGNGQAIFTIDRITVFEAKITQAREWPATTQNLPNPLPNPLSEILHLMQENPHITYTELASRLHISRESIRKYLKTLRDKYQLITRVGGTRGSWVTHTRPEK